MTAAGRLPAYVALGSAGLFLGLLLGRPEPVVVGAPFLLAAALGLLLARPPDFDVELRLDRERAVEGERVGVELAVTARGPVDDLRLQLRLPAGLRVVGRAELEVSLPAGGRWERRLEIACGRWGGYRVGDLVVAATGRLGLVTFTQVLDRGQVLKVYPAAERLRAALRPPRSQVHAGNQVSRRKGEGIEFADIRPFVPGDAVRRVNWRVTARRGSLHVNETHPERNADVVIFLDTFTELRDAGLSSLDLAVRGAAALIDRHLAQRDRVGLIGFGGTLRWLRPSTGEGQLYRLVDSLIDTEVVLSYAWKGVEVIPRRILPPGALVIAFTPLLDERSVAALADLRARGHQLAIVELVAESFVTSGPTETERLAHRLWIMEREALRARFRQLGIPVAAWRQGATLQEALEDVRGFRWHARLVRG